ncbi:DUF4065 domain-containing protein [Pseudanabaena sp. FACHB-1998]|uniref:Panacea domain-containing protein n=1 Tax=Pseudanabaena sp. FACHB-1998 TaxID=2692858 RepID=UPI0016817ABC|nr:type II toxin-antitoxin system antitoxin SocA domain-containing protein [Pseudanabaena sp. FACHB-1998]MBD2177437.1 DUF4065 domain-containing protein [Pseudanabaena sp. FACHB-1998]
MATVQDTVIIHDIANVNIKATAYDVAAYIVDKQVSTTDSGIPAMKLQKLIYYAQAWSLVWDDKALFIDRIEAWANGPVVPDLYKSLYGQFMIVGVKGNPNVFTDVERETIDSVLKYYGDKSSQWLTDLVRNEEPWINARRGLAVGERGDRVISWAAMAEYYGSLQ